MLENPSILIDPTSAGQDFHTPGGVFTAPAQVSTTVGGDFHAPGGVFALPAEDSHAPAEHFHTPAGVCTSGGEAGDHRFFAALALLTSLRIPAECSCRLRIN